MRALLLAVQERGGVKGTAKKNLPRSLVAELLEVTGSQEEREETLAMNKVVNEIDYFPVHLARVVCEVAGLLRIRSGTFAVPRKHQGLLKEERAGELYRTLFLAFFRKFNLGYLMHYGPNFPGIQATAGYTLYRVGVAARKWRTITELYPDVFLPAVRAEIETGIVDDPFLKVEEVVVRNVIEPLVMWGVLEGRFVQEKYWKRLDAVRIAPIYDAVLRFQL